MKNDIHIGNFIKQKLVEMGHSVSWLAKQMNYDRGNLHKMLENKDMNTHIIRRILYVLKYNFVKEISQHADEILAERDVKVTTK
ncbi:MAG: hypothetical protein LBN95_00110 [Prevotellaceae bacterium]|jgi:predicted transcriptional regulator|nr:hypothetical protein [Prevotellaceae bacterium]